MKSFNNTLIFCCSNLGMYKIHGIRICFVFWPRYWAVIIKKFISEIGKREVVVCHFELWKMMINRLKKKQFQNGSFKSITGPSITAVFQLWSFHRGIKSAASLSINLMTNFTIAEAGSRKNRFAANLVFSPLLSLVASKDQL